jgi:MFS family permease
MNQDTDRHMSDKIFYGWVIVAIAALGMCFGQVGAFIYGFSSFILPLSKEFGWTRGEISLGITVTNAAMIAVAPTVGMLIDRFGVKRILVPSTFFFGAILSSLYFLSHLWQFYLTILALTVLGGATSSIAYIRLIVAWFEKKKGLAMGLGISGAGIGAMVIPPLVNHVVETWGWREAYVVLGLVNLLVVLPAVLILAYDKPSELKTFSDGLAARTGSSGSHTLGPPGGYTFRQSIRTGQFWKLVVATAFLGTALGGTTSNLIPLLVEKGSAVGEAASIASLLGLSIVVSRIFSGYLLDRYHAPYVAGIFLLTSCIGLLALAEMNTGISAKLATMAIGIGLGAELDVLGFLCTQYFGRVSLGRTYGVLYVLFSVGGSLGAYLAGHSYDVYASYRGALLCASVLVLVAVAIVVTLGPYPNLSKSEANVA